MVAGVGPPDAPRARDWCRTSRSRPGPGGFRLEEVAVHRRAFGTATVTSIVPLHHSEQAARAISGAELTIFGGEGHVLARRFPEIASSLARS